MQYKYQKNGSQKMLRLDDSFFESMAEKSDFKDGNHL